AGARPRAQLLVRAIGRDLIVIADRLGQLPLFLEREPRAGQRAITHGGVVRARLRRRPEGLERRTRALLLQLALPHQELSLGAHARVIALGRDSREARRVLEAPSAKGRLGEVE